MQNESEILMQFHPRAFAAFGSDLVTNDAVAVTELVKNSYDAFARNVAVVFGEDEGKKYIEIIDDGLGMSREIIKKAWAVIATPYKRDNPYVIRDGKKRAVSGNKGLGRFSAARLGKKIQIYTKNQEDICFFAEIDWNKFENAVAIEDCKVILRPYQESMLIKQVGHYFETDSGTGTVLRITDLNDAWDDIRVYSLQSSLARLVSPFEQIDDFKIYMSYYQFDKVIKVEPHEFIKNPPYCIRGNVDENGMVCWNYKHVAKGTTVRQEQGKISWNDAKYGFDKISKVSLMEEDNIPYQGGSFSFEIRTWDLDTQSIAEVHDVFGVQKREIRQTIAKYKGLSVYRDNILVLPKSDSAKDWLGIDIRRVSALGKRLSTSQIVGILSVTSEKNPDLKDTTDREKLVDTLAYNQFCKIAETIIQTLENLRNLDKKPNTVEKNPTLIDLLTPLSPTVLESQVELMVKDGKTTEDILNVIHEYSANTENSISELNDRLVYYAQTASLGSVALVVMHEIRSAMNVIKRFLNRLRKINVLSDEKSLEYLVDAEESHRRLIEVASSFAPLYRKTLKEEEFSTDLNEAISGSIRLISVDRKNSNIIIENEISNPYKINMHIGEIQTVLINLLDNASFWLQRQSGEKKIIIALKLTDNNKVEIEVSDNGPGIGLDVQEKVFQPGVTSKPHGIGMGLVIVTEILHRHNCTIRTINPGNKGGATFIFELPLA